MDNPGLPDALWTVLDRRLWHATDRDGFEAILSDGTIRMHGDRYKASFCKIYNGVSLMDFGPTAIDIPGRFPEWRAWMDPCRSFGDIKRTAVWLEIDRPQASAQLIEPPSARAAWNNGNHMTQLIFGVEACHRGQLPVTAIVSALLIDRHDHRRFQQYAMVAGVDKGLVGKFEQSLPPPPREDALVKALWRGREASRRTTQTSDK